MSTSSQPRVPGVRERARTEITAEILTAGRRQLATVGAAGLSLRAIAREVGVVSSAVYRYVASRDELLTLLLVESYNALGAVAEAAAAPRRDRSPAARFLTTARAIRRWGVSHPHEWALLYGSPVPGYAAPSDTIGPASRTTFALVGIIADAHRDGVLEPPAVRAGDVPDALRTDLAAVREATGAELSDEVLVAMIAGWTQLFGLVSFELFGQTQNVFHRHASLFDATVTTMARAIGLPAT